MKILSILRYPTGGIRTYLNYVYGSMNSERFRFTLIMPDELDAPLVSRDLSALGHRAFLVSRRAITAGLLCALVKELRAERYDLIHAHGFKAGLITAAVNSITRLPFVLTPHDVLTDDNLGSALFLKRTVLSMLLRRATVVQFLNADAMANVLDHVPRLRLNPSRLRVIPTGIRIDLDRTTPPEDRRKLKNGLGLDPESFVIGFFSRFMPQKGFDELIDAVGRLNVDMKRPFVVLAVNDGDYIREYREEIRRRGLEKRFRFGGFTTDLTPFFHAVDVLVMPSRREAQSLLALETFVHGTPLIASSCVGLRETVKNTPATVVAPRDPVALANALTDVSVHQVGFLERARAFRSIAIERFDVKKTAIELEGLFRELAR